MTQRNENSVEYLNNGGAYLRKWHNSSGGDTPAVLRNAGILNENNYTTSVGFQLNQPIIIDAYGGIESNVEYATAGFKSWVNPSTPSNIKALSNLLEKFKQSDFNLAVTAGESREAWHMISDRMFKFSEALRRTRRGDLSGAFGHSVRQSVRHVMPNVSWTLVTFQGHSWSCTMGGSLRCAIFTQRRNWLPNLLLRGLLSALPTMLMGQIGIPMCPHIKEMRRLSRTKGRFTI